MLAQSKPRLDIPSLLRDDPIDNPRVTKELQRDAAALIEDLMLQRDNANIMVRLLYRRNSGGGNGGES